MASRWQIEMMHLFDPRHGCRIALSIFVILSAGTLSACGRDPASRDVVATVNDEAIRPADFRSLPGRESSPEKQLDSLIDERLLIQEAKKLRLDEAEPFIRTIKLFWEQTLIRDLIRHKEAEFAAKVSVDESEIQAYYSRLEGQRGTLEENRDRIRGILRGEKVRGLIETWLVDAREGARIDVNREILEGIN
ncbi:MAG: hypothetical protein HQL11_04005 [Candidatus Omnitrophica bacterium]|nr:hypothetical protein [Candidatus Omnitrophota bacterium]